MIGSDISSLLCLAKKKLFFFVKTLIILFLVTSGNSALAGIAGTYQGQYKCQQRAIPLTLTITLHTNENITALFEFSPADLRQKGRYKMSGTFNKRTGDFRLTPTTWVPKPPGYYPVGLKGKLLSAGRAIRGEVLDPSCGIFFLQKEYDMKNADKVPIEFILPNWKLSRMQRIYVSKAPTFFDYMDNIDAGTSPELIRQKIKKVEKSFVKRKWQCAKRAILKGRNTVFVRNEIPAGENWFTFACIGRCNNVKYSIAIPKPGYIWHSGLSTELPLIMTKGPNTYFHQHNIGFIFFEGTAAMDGNAPMPTSWHPTLPEGTEIRITHWLSSALSLIGGTDCNE